MTRDLTIRWVDAVPDGLEQGHLYISVEYATTVHLCACGCSSEVVAPLSPQSWKLIFDGTVSLTPSIGNWSFACRSHYWIRSNQIVWAAAWSDDEVARARERDRSGHATSIASAVPTAGKRAAFQRVPVWLRRKFPSDG